MKLGRRWRAALPWARTAVVLAAGAGLVIGAGAVPHRTTLSFAPAQVQPAEPAHGTVAQSLSESLLVCPGPPGLGLADASIEEAASTETLLAVAAPDEVVPARADAASNGSLRVGTDPDGSDEQSSQAGEVLQLEVDEALAPRILGAQALAVGVAGLQWHLGTAEQELGLTATACAVPQTESWLLAGGADAGRLERLVLVNPGPDPITVSATVHGAAGRLPSIGGQEVALAGHGRTVLLLDALAAGEDSPAVRVTSDGGPVVAFLADRWLDGTLDRGLELTAPVAAASEEVVVPIATLPEDAQARLRLAVPGEESAVVQVRALTDQGPVALAADVSVVDAESVLDVDLADLPDGATAVHLRSDVPVTGAVEVRTAVGDDVAADLAWFPSSAAVGTVAGTPLPAGELDAELVLASAEGGQVDVVTVDTDGVPTSQQVDVPAATTVSVDVSDAESVWLISDAATVYAGLGLSTLAPELAPSDEDEPADDDPADDPDADDDQPRPVLLAGVGLNDLQVSREVWPATPWLP